MTAKNYKVLNIGQCGPDTIMITHMLKSFSATPVPAASMAEVQRALAANSFDLILVNRVFDLDGYSGIECIKTIKADANHAATPVMLVSNYADAQAQAVEAGALPGFGKAELTAPATKERLSQILK